MTTFPTNCPEPGVWRAWLDGEDTADLSRHLDSCPACSDLLVDLRDNASMATDALRSVSPDRLPTSDDVAMARLRLGWRQRRFAAAVEPVATAASPSAPGLLSRIPTPWRIAASGLAATVMVSLLVAFTPEGRTAAAAFLSQFRSQQVAPIEVSPQSLNEITRTLNGLGNLGTVSTPIGTNNRPGIAAARPPEPRTVTLAEASRVVGFALQTPDPTTLPAGVNATPAVQVVPASEFRFTFDKAKASGYLQSNGHSRVTMPDRFDGATLVVSTPAAALLQYSARDSHQALIIGQSGLLVVSVDGKVSLDEMRDFLLGLPGLPKETTDQLRVIRNWNETLPIPIPTDKINWKHESFNGSQGLLLNDNTGIGSAAIWQSGGHLYGVAGSLKANDLKRVVESLAVR
jgi:hypothetical protein